ncbi:hypothetical protein D3C84_1219470 [compost metagenome]
MDQSRFAIDEGEVDSSLAGYVHEAAVADYHCITEARGELNGVQHRFARNREIGACAEHPM